MEGVLISGCECSLCVCAGEAVDWSSEDGEKILPLMLPSHQQINFSIGENLIALPIVLHSNINTCPAAHEVSHLQHMDWLYRIILSPLTLILSYHAARIAPKCECSDTL